MRDSLDIVRAAFSMYTLSRMITLKLTEGVDYAFGCDNLKASNRKPGGTCAELKTPTEQENEVPDHGPEVADKDGEKEISVNRRVGGRWQCMRGR